MSEGGSYTALAARPAYRGGVTDEPERLLAAAAGGDRRALARCCSLVERGSAAGRRLGAAAYRQVGDGGWVVGLTGAPGAGKSTLTGQLVRVARAQGREVGVVAVDPSSPYSGGALLGDRIRMEEHFTDPGVFIRSLATRGHLGGLALAVPEVVRVIVAAGFGCVLVETVGVGQVEVEVASSADTTVVVVHPGWGDAVQANKAGLLEVADVLVVNKADQPGVAETARQLDDMLGWAAAGQRADGWRPPIVRTAAAEGKGIDELWAALGAHRDHLVATGDLAVRRGARRSREFRIALAARIDERVRNLDGGARYQAAVDAVVTGALDPNEAADRLLDEGS